MAKFTPLTASLYEYCIQHQSAFHPVLADLIKATSEHELAKYASNEQQVAFLAMIAELMGAKRMIEVGVLTGVSTLSLALTLKEKGCIYALEQKAELIDFAKPYWQSAKVDHHIKVMLGDANDSLDQLIEQQIDPIDLVYIDANKGGYVDYFDKCRSMLRPGGLIIADNAFWHGLVADESDSHNITRKVRRFNTHVNQQDGQCLLLPIGDGMMMYRQ